MQLVLDFLLQGLSWRGVADPSTEYKPNCNAPSALSPARQCLRTSDKKTFTYKALTDPAYVDESRKLLETICWQTKWKGCNLLHLSTDALIDCCISSKRMLSRWICLLNNWSNLQDTCEIRNSPLMLWRTPRDMDNMNYMQYGQV